MLYGLVACLIIIGILIAYLLKKQKIDKRELMLYKTELERTKT
jgi:hypothetical protein